MRVAARDGETCTKRAGRSKRSAARGFIGQTRNAMKANIRPLPPGFAGPITVTVCVNRREPAGGIVMPSCGARGSEAIAEAIEAGIAARGLPARFATIRCLGLCQKGPNVRVAPSNSWFHEIKSEDVPALLDALAGQLAEASRDNAAAPQP
jgi:(2Fe-2S) ferredoxin